MQDIARRKRWVALAVLVLGLLGTLFASNYARKEAEAAAENEFKFEANEIMINIKDRMAANALTLYSGRALFYSSLDVTREEWRVFTNELRLEQQMPGTQGIGYAMIIPPDQLDEHMAAVRAEGFSDYLITPVEKRDFYTSIIYLEPFSERNLRAFGFDMFSEPTRRAAMERARDEDLAALSGKVTLVQETNEDVQAGTLMYVPVYRHGMPYSTVEERRAAIIGWVYSPYRMDDLMKGILDHHDVHLTNRLIGLEIYDGSQLTPEALLYDSRSEAEKNLAVDYPYAAVVPIEMYGRLWTVRFTQLGGLAATTDYDSQTLVLLAGASISLLLFGLTVMLLRTERYLESIRLLAETDALTGVFNRRKILDLAEVEFTRARRHRHDLAVLMIDLNHFKHINDTYGHATGDKALRLTARAMQQTLRKDIDRIGRFGGDEFVILLPETNLEKIEVIAERLRARVATDTQHMAIGLEPVSLSIGAATLDDTVLSLQELVERADRAMYENKRQNQN